VGSVADVSKTHVTSILRVEDGGSVYVQNIRNTAHISGHHGLEVIGEEGIMIFCT
jgi:hypothetical protein